MITHRSIITDRPEGDVRPRRYYRGYSLILTAANGWEIHWGERLDIAGSLARAEAIVDGWLDAP